MPAVADNQGHVQERFLDGSDGKLHQIKTQDCDAILTLMREYGEMAPRRVNTQDSTKLLGSVPTVLALSWAQEWGVTLLSKEWLEKARDRLRNDPDWRLLRAGK